MFPFGSDYVFTPRTSSVGGSAYDDQDLFEAAWFVSHDVGTSWVMRQPRPSHWPQNLRASVVTGSYGLIVLLPWRTKTTTWHGQARPMAGPPVAVLRPLHPPSFRTACAAGRCRSFRTFVSSVFVLPLDRRSALRSELCSWLFVAHISLAANQRSSLYRRLPTALSSPGNSSVFPSGRRSSPL